MVSFINQPTPALRLSTVAFYAAMEYHPRFKLHAIVFHCQSPFQKSRCFCTNIRLKSYVFYQQLISLLFIQANFISFTSLKSHSFVIKSLQNVIFKNILLKKEEDGFLI